MLNFCSLLNLKEFWRQKMCFMVILMVVYVCLSSKWTYYGLLRENVRLLSIMLIVYSIFSLKYTIFPILTQGGQTNSHLTFQGLSGEFQGYFQIFQGMFLDNFTQSPGCNANDWIITYNQGYTLLLLWYSGTSL